MQKNFQNVLLRIVSYVYKLYVNLTIRFPVSVMSEISSRGLKCKKYPNQATTDQDSRFDVVRHLTHAVALMGDARDTLRLYLLHLSDLATVDPVLLLATE